MKRELTSLPLKSGKTLWYRENSSDMAMWKENPYKGFNFYDDDVIMDIGANMGDFPLRFSDKVKWIHSYEPMADTFKVLEKNVNSNKIKNCSVYNVAIASKEGETTIYLNDEAKLAHAVASVLPIRGRTAYNVKTLDFEKEIKRIKPTIIKMDIEGGEYDILKEVSDSAFKNCRIFLLETHMQFLKLDDGMEWNKQIGKRFKKIFGSAVEKKTFYFKIHNCSVWTFQKK